MTTKPRLLRIFRAEVKPGHEADWKRVFDDGIPKYLEGSPGLIAWYRGTSLEPESNEYVVVTLWRDKEALRAFSGASFGPVLFPTQHDFADSITVEQYEIE